MLLNELRPPKGAVKNRKRLGRGESSGHGKTSGRGNKGQKARSGGFHKRGFEGGQMPLQRRLPKRGFVSLSKKIFAIVNIAALAKFPANTQIDFDFLKKNGLVKKLGSGLKILGDGEIKHALVIKAACFSGVAKAKIEKAGGQAVTVQ
ncbi:MAG: 50S ribosomal protein L15 [Deltaproteobacteria bacterium RIFCSPLOWO2_12_FULL_40_28]|nr:MAG: 50S ribosomal protein L15 [Deltaproteobacteria bacterium RIFCSPHIGHO2_02_FULL_40_28]OGQ18990.1 MAG: 50S ribosomal protein L15 [Deltaproteobacteria bacterium RIFCSPHIGHO2_12_FULL_40_32]OGQ39533.1 MAG: 50S ribosomal protein L15 [Deltaproteobacteria bacterium RIFCSPLOWO2_02_FULL_40_36]OGQ53423.1 MAG: 50S ribosomal protein L15 [Deltaproteobacteria bacterium RIFCSPLOWO2_12_FULL_40_28]